MATNKQPFFFNSISGTEVEINNSDGTALQAVFTAGTDGGAVTNLTATTTDTSDVIAVISRTVGAQTNVIGEVIVKAGSGTDGATPTTNLLDVTALNGVLLNDGSLPLGVSGVLSVNAKSAVTAATVLSISAIGGSYSV